MLDFSLCIPTRIHFGRNALDHLAEEVKRYGGPVLIVYGGGSIKRTGLYDKVKAILADCGADAVDCAGVKPNPTLGKVQEGIALCRQHNVRLVLAVGGGSVIDTAKAIANGARFEGDYWDLHMKKAQNTDVLPLGTILTIAAAGSEMSSSCVITRESDNLKCGRGTPLNYPTFSIENPEWTFTLPPYQTACGIVDIMAHMMERYFTTIEHVELTDRMIEGALITVMNNAVKVMENPEDYNARAEIMWAGTLAHNGLLNTGRIGDWGCHKLEHELSAYYDIAHGGGLAILFPAWIRYAAEQGLSKKTAQFAVRVLDVPESYGSEKEISLEGADRLENFYHSLGLTTTLHENGIGEERLAEMSARAAILGGGKAGVYLAMDAEACEAVYRLAL